MKYIIYTIFFIFFFSCKKDITTTSPSVEHTQKIDYREKYIGNFYFTTIIRSWGSHIPGGEQYDTVYYDNGKIYLYEDDLCPIDTHHFFFLLYRKRISIKYRSSGLISPDIDSTGVFEPYSNGPSNNRNGKFINEDSVEIVMNSGGLGGGVSQRVYGKRIN